MTPTAAEAASARAAVAELSDLLLAHLEHEEDTIELVSEAKKDAPQMKAGAKAVRKAHKGNTGMFIAWLNDGIQPDAKAFLDHEIPRPVQFIARQTSGRRYTKAVAPAWRGARAQMYVAAAPRGPDAGKNPSS